MLTKYINLKDEKNKKALSKEGVYIYFNQQIKIIFNKNLINNYNIYNNIYYNKMNKGTKKIKKNKSIKYNKKLEL